MKKIGFVVLFLCFVTLDAKGSDLEKLFDKATSYYKAGEPKKAILLYKEALAFSPSGIKKDIVHYNLGTSYLEDAQFDLAISQLQNVLENKESLPQYLLEKCRYNLMLAFLKKSDVLLKKEEEILDVSDLRDVKEMLEKTSEIYSSFSNKENGEAQEELLSAIWVILKELKSKFSLQERKLLLNGISLENGVERLRNQIGNQVYQFETLGEKKLSPSMSQYFLGKAYVREKKGLHLWEKVEKLFEKKIEEEGLKSSDATDSKAEFEGLLTQFQESYNNFISSLDCMKENLLWQGRYKCARAKLNLDMLDIYFKNEDPIEYCLNQRANLFQKQNKSIHHTALFNSLNKELKMLNSVASPLVDKSCEMLESKLNEPENDLRLSLGNTLKSNLKTNSDYLYDCYIYEQMKKLPEEIVYPIYQYLSTKLNLEEPLLKQYSYQLKATKERFNLQMALNNNEEKKKKVNFAHQKLLSACQNLLDQKSMECRQNLEDFLLSWNFRQFMLRKVGVLRSNFKKALEKNINDSDEIFDLLSQTSHLDEIQKKAELSLDESEFREKLHQGFVEIQSSINLEQDLKDIPLKKLLLENGYRWGERTYQKLNIDPKPSKNLLKEGIEEQKHALKFAEVYPTIKSIEPKQENILLIMVKDSQNYPLNAIESFESTYYQEKASEQKELKHDQVLYHFQEGLKCARTALKMFNEPVISWNVVNENQKKAIEYWEKALKNYDASNKNSSETNSTSNQNGNSSDDNQRNQNDEVSLDGGDSEKKEDSSGGADSQKIMGLLERLGEMFQEDQLVHKEQKKAKEGLRPW